MNWDLWSVGRFWIQKGLLTGVLSCAFVACITPWPGPEIGGGTDVAAPSDTCIRCDVLDVEGDAIEGADVPLDVQGSDSQDEDSRIVDVGIPDVPEPVAPTGVLEGRIVTGEGSPVDGSSVLACNETMCFPGNSLADGTFAIDQLAEGPYKIQVMGSLQGFMNMAFHAVVFQDQTTVLSRDVVVVPIVEAMAFLGEDAGGTLVVAQGAVEITAAAGALDYPLGFEETMNGVSVPLSALPPHDVEPWVGAPPGAAAFHFNPFGAEADPALAFRVLTGLLPETSYGVWAVEIKLGRLEKMGIATTDADGVLESGGAVPGLGALSSVVLVPEAPGEPSP